MCGLLGGHWINPPINLESKLKEGLSSIAHRGPDASNITLRQTSRGTLALGHTRLKIIDLSNEANQPMSCVNSRYSLVYNGEIYNYVELRRELEELGVEFQTDSDTEVLLAAWAQWGTNCLKKLVGMFAFAIIDSLKNTLTLVRDAFGIKPLFYYIDREEDSIAFCSEIEPLLKLKGSNISLNLQRIYDYLIHGIQDCGNKTFVDEISQLKPASFAIVSLESNEVVDESRWWTPAIGESSGLTFTDAVEALREIFLNNVKLHLNSDVPVGAALSGGIDSSAIVCAMRYIEPEMDIHTFSYISSDDQYSEEYWIDLVNENVGAKETKVYVQENDISKDIEKLIVCQGEPFCSTSMYAQFRVFQAARECEIPVILEGQGADEILAGYSGYPGQRLKSLCEKGHFLRMLQFARAWKNWGGRESQSPWVSFYGQLLPESIHHWFLRFGNTHSGTSAWLRYNSLRKAGVKLQTPWMGRKKENRGRRVIEALAHSISDHELPSLLRFGDRNAMNFSIENRVPYLTTDIVDFLFSLPERYLISESGETKHVFRAAMKGIVPDKILKRRDKIGFVTPMGSWMSSLLTPIEESIKISSLDFVDRDNLLGEIKNATSSGNVFPSNLWRVINLYQFIHLNKFRNEKMYSVEDSMA